ncbi:hypothetical protein BHE74_00038181 [Ensete ventricosum]|nr:hypothetical protein BHE74_00038181 [Ensete ventricosum]
MGCNTSTAREAGKRERRSGAGDWKGARVALDRGGKHESSKEWRSDRKRSQMQIVGLQHQLAEATPHDFPARSTGASLTMAKPSRGCSSRRVLQDDRH